MSGPVETAHTPPSLKLLNGIVVVSREIRRAWPPSIASALLINTFASVERQNVRRFDGTLPHHETRSQTLLERDVVQVTGWVAREHWLGGKSKGQAKARQRGKIVTISDVKEERTHGVHQEACEQAET